MESSPGMIVGGVLTVAGILWSWCCSPSRLSPSSTASTGDGSDRASSGSAVTRNAPPARARGVDPEVLRSLPVTVYRARKDSAEEGMECTVCLAELEDGEEARFLPRCGHGFLAECIDLWLASHSTCPLCRLAVGKPDMSLAPQLASLPPVPPEPAN